MASTIEMNDEMPHSPRRVVINVSGNVYETFEHTLSMYPDTLLGDPAKRIRHYDERRKEFVFFRDSRCFDAILFFYQSRGILKRPEYIDRKLFEQELGFFELPKYHCGKKCDVATDQAHSYDIRARSQVISKIFEEPFSSKWTASVGVFNMLFIITSIIVYSIATLPQFSVNAVPTRGAGSIANYADVFSNIEAICMALFTLEYLIRLSNAPSRLSFLSSTLGIIELVTLVSFYVSIVTDKYKGETSLLSHLFRFSRVSCALQVFRLGRYSDGLRGLLETILKGIGHIQPIIVIIPVMVTSFASLIFYAELSESNQESKSLFDWIWFVVITWTTVGYGDIYPKSVLGKVLGMFCALFGVMFFCFLTPTMLKYFFKFYYVQRYLNQSDSKKNALLVERLEDYFYTE